MYFINSRKRINFSFLTLLIVSIVFVSMSSMVLYSSAHSNSNQQNPTATFTVTNSNDSGAGSLRQAILNANATAADDVISFAIPAGSAGCISGVCTITLTSGELAINDAATAGTLTITNSTGASNLLISGNNTSRVFYLNGGGNLTISGVTITKGNGTGTTNSNFNGTGGGILNSGTLNLTSSTVSGNTASSQLGGGGGIYNTGTLNLTSSTVSDNTANNRGGGIYTVDRGLNLTNSTVSGNTAAAGGGIYNGFILNLTNSTVSDNMGTGAGGGIFSSGGSTLTNSTVSGNTSPGAGGIFNNKGILNLTGVTVTRNKSTSSTSSGTGGIFNYDGSFNPPKANLNNTIVAGNTMGMFSSSADFLGTVAAGSSFNLIGNGSGTIGISNGVNGNQVGSSANPIDPKLGTLANNGGTTQTHELLAGSPAINTGNNANVTEATDQRGFARIVGGTVDIGAFEIQTVTCTYSISPTNQQFTADGGNTTVNVISTSGCTWMASSNASWISVTSGSSGNGNGTVSLTVQPNTAIARTGTVTIAGQTFTVNQASGCSYTINPTSVNISANGGNGSFNLTSGAGCTWTAVSNNSWITITSAASGTGNGTVTFSVQANNGVARTGTITVADQTFIVNQASGCSYSLSSTNVVFNETGGNGTVNVSAVAGCPYSAVSNDSWLTITSGAAGTGSGSVAFTVAANTSPGRTGTITIAGQTFTVTQSGGCSFTIFPASINVGASSGTGSFRINSGAGCPRTAVSNASWLTITAGSSSSGSGDVTFIWTANTGQARTGTITAAGQTFTVNQAAGIINHTAFDFDGDGKADVSVFRQDNGVWYLLNSTNGFTGAQFGVAADKLVPADYDGDGKTDIAVYRNGTWYLQRSSAGFTGFAFGDSNDIPQPADFDGDGKADLAVYRPSNGTWYVYNLATNQSTSAQFGASTDTPAVGDYNGDGKADYAVFRPSNGTWYIARPGGIPSQNFDSIQFGDANDKAVPTDYDGDGKTDVAVFRPSNGTWYLNRSAAGFTGVQFGISTDLPTPADYDGDGKADVAVFRSGVWYLNRSTAGFTGIQFGANTDKPVPNAFVP